MQNEGPRIKCLRRLKAGTKRLEAGEVENLKEKELEESNFDKEKCLI